MLDLLTHIALVVALAGYGVSSGLFLYAFPRPHNQVKTHRLAFVIFCAASLLITLAMLYSFSSTYYSQTSGLILISALSLVTIIADLKFKVKLIGIMVAPIATIILLFLAFSYPHVDHTQHAPPDLLATFHIGFAIIGQALSILAFALSVLYLLQQRALKKKLFNFITTATPPLDKLEVAMMFCLWVGFICLSLALLSGAIYFHFFVPTSFSDMFIKISWAMLVWIWYLAILVSKNVFAKSASVVARMSVIGFHLLLLTFFGLKQWGGFE